MASKRRLSEARLSKLIRNMEREPANWEGPMEPELVLEDLREQLRRKREVTTDGVKAKAQAQKLQG